MLTDRDFILVAVWILASPLHIFSWSQCGFLDQTLLYPLFSTYGRRLWYGLQRRLAH
jgi:hypothetical protein